MSTTEIQVHDHLGTLSRNATVRSVGHARCRMPPCRRIQRVTATLLVQAVPVYNWTRRNRTSLMRGLALRRAHLRRMSMHRPSQDLQNRRECRGHSCG